MKDNAVTIEQSTKKVHQRQQLILALLQHPTIEKAAESISISTVTAWRTSRTPEFQHEYRNARQEAFSQCMGRLQQASSAAVSTLCAIMQDPEAPAAVRLRAADSILRHAKLNEPIEEGGETGTAQEPFGSRG
jgi:hypothetical protein